MAAMWIVGFLLMFLAVLIRPARSVDQVSVGLCGASLCSLGLTHVSGESLNLVLLVAASISIVAVIHACRSVAERRLSMPPFDRWLDRWANADGRQT